MIIEIKTRLNLIDCENFQIELCQQYYVNIMTKLCERYICILGETITEDHQTNENCICEQGFQSALGS